MKFYVYLHGFGSSPGLAKAQCLMDSAHALGNVQSEIWQAIQTFCQLDPNLTVS